MRRALQGAVAAGDLDSWAPHAAAFFFGAGSAIAVAIALIPGRAFPTISVGIGIAGLLTTIVLLVWAQRLGRRSLNLLLALGTACVSAGVLTASRAMGPDALVYVWVGLHAGFFLGRRALVGHVALVAVGYGVVLALSPRAEIPLALLPQALVLVTGTVATAGAWSLGLRRLAESLLERQTRLARTDVLTGLPNRGELLRRGRGLADAADSTIAVALLDLDGFKDVNDSLGHAAGDTVLREVARRLIDRAPEDAMVARLGGDEFALLLRGADEEAAIRAATRAHEALVAPFGAPGGPVRVGASIGVAVVPPGGSFDVALRDADIAMYEAKRDGGGAHAFVPSMRRTVLRERRLEAQLQQAIGRELSLRYQPIVDPRTGDAAMVEALVRWEHPEGGTVPPGDFVPLAERTGQIVALGRWVLHEACRSAATWPTAVAVSVNLSPRQLVDDDLVDDVRAALREAGLPARRLVLEVTESTIMTEPRQAAERLAELRALGVRIAVDDFGTGHSSLAALQRLPVTDLKLAREFVAPLEDPEHDPALARAIVALGHALGLRLVGEGVELERQLDLLRRLGCDLVQGFLIARPMPGEDLTAWLARAPERHGDVEPVVAPAPSPGPRRHAPARSGR